MGRYQKSEQVKIEVVEARSGETEWIGSSSTTVMTSKDLCLVNSIPNPSLP